MMGRVILDMALSVDGFISGPHDEDFGLHDYFFSPSHDTARVIEDSINTTGAIIMGRRSYDIGAKQGGFVDDPYQAAQFVLTHQAPQTPAEGAESFVFVSDGIDSALRQAQAAAGKKAVVIGGGANTAHQFLAAGRVDEIYLHLVPKLLGSGTRLFDHTGGLQIQLELSHTIVAPDAIHLRYAVGGRNGR
jgi:dihydrofolate reductase